MATNSFFPSSEAEQIIWLSHHLATLPSHGTDCGLSEAEVIATQTDLQYYIWLLQHWHPSIQRDAKEATAYKLLMVGGTSPASARPHSSSIPEPPPAPEPGLQKRLFSQIIRIKAHSGYNESIGHDLGVIASAVLVDHPTPEYSLSVELGSSGPQVRIDFKKYGHDGIWIESRINGGDWAFLAIDTVKPYLDQRPLSPGNSHETREYRLRWWDKSKANGEWSGVQKVVVG